VAETFVLSFVDKLILLEQRAGSQVHYRIMPPLAGPFHDCISIQKVARQIADSIGLTHFSFIITFAKQKKNVGGHIDLSTGGRDVFIEIDPDAIPFPDSVGAILCHEICHKWLQVMGISSPIEIDNEILTDITTVFLGFAVGVLFRRADIFFIRITQAKNSVKKRAREKDSRFGMEECNRRARAVCTSKDAPTCVARRPVWPVGSERHTDHANRDF